MAVTVGAYTHEREQSLTRCRSRIRYTDIYTDIHTVIYTDSIARLTESGLDKPMSS